MPIKKYILIITLFFCFVTKAQNFRLYTNKNDSKLYVFDNDSVSFFDVIPGGIWHTEFFSGHIISKTSDYMNVTFHPIRSTFSTYEVLNDDSLIKKNSLTFYIKDFFGNKFEEDMHIQVNGIYYFAVANNGIATIKKPNEKINTIYINSLGYQPIKIISTYNNSINVTLFNGEISNLNNNVQLKGKFEKNTFILETLNGKKYKDNVFYLKK